MAEDRQPLTGEQVTKMICDVDEEFYQWIRNDRVPAIRDYLDWCRRETMDGGILGVYYIGELGWVTEDEWDKVFDGLPEWARDAYMIEAEAAYDDDIVDDIAAAYNEGGMDALGELFGRTVCDDPDTVFFTQYLSDELECDWAEELAELDQEAPVARIDATPAPDTPAPGMGV